MKKLPLVLVLSLATVFIVACGEDKPADSLTKDEVICAKILAKGGTCSPNGASGGTVTATSTVTVTQTN